MTRTGSDLPSSPAGFSSQSCDPALEESLPVSRIATVHGGHVVRDQRVREDANGFSRSRHVREACGHFLARHEVRRDHDDPLARGLHHRRERDTDVGPLDVPFLHRDLGGIVRHELVLRRPLHGPLAGDHLANEIPALQRDRITAAPGLPGPGREPRAQPLESCWIDGIRIQDFHRVRGRRVPEPVESSLKRRGPRVPASRSRGRESSSPRPR